MENEVITKSEFKYLSLIDKLEQTVEKLEDKNKQTEKENAELLSKLDAAKKENVVLTTTNESLAKKIDELEIECNDTVHQCQEHVNDIEGQHDVLEQQIAELKKQILPDDEMLFYYGCRADTIMEDAFNNGTLVLTPDYLKEKKFPDVLLTDKDFDGIIITTTNFKLTKSKDENNFTLTKNLSDEKNKTQIS